MRLAHPALRLGPKMNLSLLNPGFSVGTGVVQSLVNKRDLFHYCFPFLVAVYHSRTGEDLH